MSSIMHIRLKGGCKIAQSTLKFEQKEQLHWYLREK